MSVPQHRWSAERNGLGTASGRARYGLRDSGFVDRTSLQSLQDGHRYKGQKTDHCVHLLQVRDCPADVPPPPDAFEVWVVHRSLCRFCKLGGSQGAAAAGLSEAELALAADDSRKSSVSSGGGSPAGNNYATLGSFQQPRPQRPTSAPLSRKDAQRAERHKLSLARRDRAQRLAAGDCASELVLLARRTNISLDKVRELKHLFDEFDIRTKGLLDRKDFNKLLRSVVIREQEDKIPEHLSDERWFEPAMDSGAGGGGGTMDFEGFLRWYQANSFDQSLLTSGVSRTLKTMSRKFGLSISFVESIHRVFQESDESGNDAMEYPEFKRVVLRLLKAEEGEISETMLERLWMGATKQGVIDEIDFETFLLWYTQHFGETVRQKTGVQLLKEFYRSIRPVAGAHARGMNGA
mmetsp:Transcript_115418/g.203793  ORF Transcript_115418/g.203793 Transcript_115418/m.203793 type:complete len:407 (+) Transcript_115418:32-1252(+)